MTMTGDRSKSRSVFVGNIPHDSNEEELKKFFSQAGPVVSFRMMREADGRSKGYGFCEYHDKETTEIALKNLNNINFNGRVLRVAEASGDQNREGHKDAQKPYVSSSRQSNCEEQVKPENMPELISKTISSLAPERIFEILRELQDFVKNKPTEAQELLTKNPQLTYALLQASVASNLITPATAMNLLHKKNELVQPLLPNDDIKGPEGEIRQQAPCLVQQLSLSSYEEDKSFMNSVAGNNSMFPDQQCAIVSGHPNVTALMPSVHVPMKDNFNNYHQPLRAPSLEMASGNFVSRFDLQTPQPLISVPFGSAVVPSASIPIDSVFGENRNNFDVKANEQRASRQGFDIHLRSNRDFAKEEPPNQRFHDNRHRTDRGHGADTSEAAQRSGNNQHRQSTNDPRLINRKFENHIAEYNMEDCSNKRFLDNHYGNSMDAKVDEPVNHGFEHQFRPNRDFRMMDHHRPNHAFENEYRSFNKDERIPREVGFGEDRYRPGRSRDHDRSNRYAHHPYEQRGTNKRYDSERNSENRRQPHYQQQQVHHPQQPQQTRETPRHHDHLPPPVHNQQAPQVDPALLAEILNLPEEKMAELNPEARQTVMMLKQQMNGRQL